MYAYAINRIQRPNPKEETSIEVIPARTVFESPMDKFKELEALGAARKATNDEITIYRDRQARLNGQVAAVADAQPEPETKPEDENAGDGLDENTVVELKALAESEGIDLGDATKKADILAAIRSARSAPVLTDSDNMLG